MFTLIPLFLLLLKHQQKHFLAILCCQIAMSLIDNSSQTCGGQSINKCTLKEKEKEKEKENAETNRGKIVTY